VENILFINNSDFKKIVEELKFVKNFKLKKVYPKSHIYGSDISKKSLKISLGKKIYKKLQIKNFEQLHHYKIKFDLISLIGSMTYCKNFDKLFAKISILS